MGWVVYRVPEMTKVTVQSDLIYKTADGDALGMDVYAPLDLKPGEHRPAVFLGHGRGGKGKPEWASWGRLLAASGIIGITFNYRDLPGVEPAVPMGDIADAIAYVRDHADELRVDKDHLGVMSFSGLSRYNMSAALRGSPGYIRALVSYYGWLDYVRDDETSPLHYLRTAPAAFPPIFIGKAGRDSASINESIDRFVEAARASKITFVLAVHETGQHGFDTRDDDDRSREIIQQTLAFLKQYLLAP